MASYTKTVDVVDSANSYFGSIGMVNIYRANGTYFTIPTRDTKLHLAYQRKNNRTVTQATPVFLIDFDAIPKNKRITKVKLYFYARSSYYEKIFSEDEMGASGVTINSAGWYNVSTMFESGLKNNNYIKIDQLSEHMTYPDYGLDKWLEIDSHLSSNKPYAIVTYEDVPPSRPTNLYPTNNTLNARNIIRFSWKYNSNESNNQKGFTLQYSANDGNTWTTINQTTSNQYYDMPANTLPLTGEILWKIKTVDQNDLESPYAEGKFNTAIVPPKAPIIKSPTTGYLDGERSIKFEWEFVQGTSEDVQGKYDLEYSLNKGLNWTKITESSSNQHHTISANTLQSGNIYWRVKTYNQFGDASPYSEIANFYVIASPPLPQITSVSNNAKPLIKWNSTEQQLFEIQILQNDKVIIDTGQVIGVNIREYKIDKYLKDGNYTVKLRVTNEYSLKSPWAELDFTISTVKPLKPIIEVYSGEYSVTIKGGIRGATNLVYRENVCIGEIVNDYFVDYTGENNKEYKYFIRAVDKDNNFVDSDIKLGKCSFRYNTLALRNNPENFILLRYGLNNIPRKTTRVGNIGNLVYFDGREYPTVEFTEFKELNKTLSFHLKDKEELDELLSLVDKKEILIYRDVEGENIEGIVFYVDYERTMFGYKVDFIITKVGDYSD